MAGPLADPVVTGPCGFGFSTRDCGRLAVVQAPITGSLPLVRQVAGTSSASDVTFLSAIVLLDELRAPSGLRLIRSKIWRSEEHTSELQSLMRISYAVFCLKKKKKKSMTKDNRITN